MVPEIGVPIPIPTIHIPRPTLYLSGPLLNPQNQGSIVDERTIKKHQSQTNKAMKPPTNDSRRNETKHTHTHSSIVLINFSPLSLSLSLRHTHNNIKFYKIIKKKKWWLFIIQQRLVVACHRCTALRLLARFSHPQSFSSATPLRTSGSSRFGPNLQARRASANPTNTLLVMPPLGSPLLLRRSLIFSLSATASR